MIKYITERKDVEPALVNFYDEMMNMPESNSSTITSPKDLTPDEPVHISINFLKVLTAEANIYIGYDNIKDSYVDFNFYVFGIRLIHACLDFNNPKIQIRLSPVPGTRVVGEAGIDFETGRVYIMGTFTTFGHTATFDLTLFKF